MNRSVCNGVEKKAHACGFGVLQDALSSHSRS